MPNVLSKEIIEIGYKAKLYIIWSSLIDDPTAFAKLNIIDSLASAAYITYQGRIVGYALIDPMGMDYRLQNYPSVKQMNALPINHTYLKNELKSSPEFTIHFHEKNHGQFVERYGIFEFLGQDKTKPINQMLLLDSFYPKELEQILKPHIIKAINFNLWSLKLLQ